LKLKSLNETKINKEVINFIKKKSLYKK
jgi:hypothetical protein